MQESYEIPVVSRAPSPARTAMQAATKKLGRGQGLLSLTLALLMALLIAFAVYLFADVFLAVLLGFTALPDIVLACLYYTFLCVGLVLLVIPVLAGRIRMAGMVAMGDSPTLNETFYYLASPRRLLRGIGIGVLWLCSLLFPPVLGAVALAAGNGQISLGGALALAFRRGARYTGAAFRFWLLVLWHLVLSLFTVGVLWLLYYAHHTTVAYFELTMIMMDDPKGELQ